MDRPHRDPTPTSIPLASGTDAPVPTPTPIDIESLRSRHFATHVHTYGPRDVILYHLGLGCTLEKDGLGLLYEGGTDGGGALHVLPTYAVVAAHPSIYQVPLADYIPGAKLVGTTVHMGTFPALSPLLGPPLQQCCGEDPSTEPVAPLITLPQAQALHGEQYVELYGSVPPSGKLITR